LADDFTADHAISEDIRALAEVYERDGSRVERIVDLLVAGDRTKLGVREINQRYGEVSGELRSIADRFSVVRLKTGEVNELHQTFVKSLRRMASDGQEFKFLFLSVHRDIKESDAILALPKSAIAENKGRLLDIRDRLTRAEAQIENKLEGLKQNGKTAMQALDRLEALASRHGASLGPHGSH
jgi:hypothetical protein